MMIEITSEKISVQKVITAAYSEDCGAVTVFIGTVRNNSRGQAVDHLEYEAYAEMAVKMLKAIRDEVRTQWDVRKFAIAHRTGIMEIGEISVVIAIATPHRQEGFEACQFTIDRLKKLVPIWKKEVAADGAIWVDSHA